jgi:hypothetical protein
MSEAYLTDTDDADDDPRFTFGLIVDVADTLGQHGYPTLHAKGLVDLGQALFCFLYPRTFPGFENWPS